VTGFQTHSFGDWFPNPQLANMIATSSLKVLKIAHSEIESDSNFNRKIFKSDIIKEMVVLFFNWYSRSSEEENFPGAKALK